MTVFGLDSSEMLARCYSIWYNGRMENTPFDYNRFLEVVLVRLGELKRVMTQREMARELGVSPACVSNWLGGVSKPRGHDLTRIHEVLKRAERCTPERPCGKITGLRPLTQAEKVAGNG